MHGPHHAAQTLTTAGWPLTDANWRSSADVDPGSRTLAWRCSAASAGGAPPSFSVTSAWSSGCVSPPEAVWLSGGDRRHRATTATRATAARRNRTARRDIGPERFAQPRGAIDWNHPAGGGSLRRTRED